MFVRVSDFKFLTWKIVVVLQGWRMKMGDRLLMVMVMQMATWDPLGLFTTELVVGELVSSRIPRCHCRTTYAYPNDLVLALDD